MVLNARTRHRVGRSGARHGRLVPRKPEDRMRKLALIVALAASPAAALEPLSAERHINDSLIAARVADRIRRTCPTIGARMVRAFTEARALKRYALGKGYSEAQVEAFLDSKTERARIYAAAEAYLAKKGAIEGMPESFCVVGRTEIAAKTIAGSLLVAK